MLGISEGTRHTAGKEQTCGLRVQDPDPRGRGETHTIPRPCTWAHDPWLGPQVSAGWAPKVEMSGLL